MNVVDVLCLVDPYGLVRLLVNAKACKSEDTFLLRSKGKLL